MKDEQVAFCGHSVPTCGNKKTNSISGVIFPNNVYIYRLQLCFRDKAQDIWKEGSEEMRGGRWEGLEGGRTDTVNFVSYRCFREF